MQKKSLKHQVSSMGRDNKPCCPADALRCIRQIPVNGIPTGISLPDTCLADVKMQDLNSEQEIQAALIKREGIQLHPAKS